MRTLIVLMLSVCATAQNNISVVSPVAGKSVMDFSGSTTTKPMVISASAPGTCAVGQFYFNSVSLHTFACTATNTWTQVDGGGGGGSGGVNCTAVNGTGALAINFNTAGPAGVACTDIEVTLTGNVTSVALTGGTSRLSLTWIEGGTPFTVAGLAGNLTQWCSVPAVASTKTTQNILFDATNYVGNGCINNVGTITLPGSTSGSVTLAVPPVAGANTLTFPAGTTDFSATGGTSQVVKQTSVGAPFTVGQLSCSDLSGGCTGSGGTAIAPYSATVASQTSVSVTAVTHGQGTLAIAACLDNSTPRLAVACSYTRNTSGDIVFTFNPAFTGLIQIGSGGGINLSPFSSSVTSQTSVSITAVTHGRGTTPTYSCLDNATPKNYVACAATRNVSGDLVFTFNPAFTGTIEVRP